MKQTTSIGKLLLGVLYISIAVAILVTVMLVVPAREPGSQRVMLKGEEIVITVADTPALQERGLSGHKQLKQNEGMLFVFQEPILSGFWMKDMLFPIDIIWFDEKRQIVDVWENAQPLSYPRVVTPRTSARYVLEVSAGYFTKHTLKLGDVLELDDRARYNK